MTFAVKLIQIFPLEIFLCIVVTTSDVIGAHVCDSPQSLEIGKTGILNCSFEDGFDFVLWYNTNNVTEEPLLHYRNYIKSGTGFTSGEFDITSDGSLIIRNVSIKHEHNFTASCSHPRIAGITKVVVLVLVTVKPTVSYPVIGGDNEDLRSVGFLRVDISSLLCFVEKSRPEIPLMWMIRTEEGDKNTSYTKNITREEIWYTTRVFTNKVFLYSPFLSLVVCKAISPPGMLRQEESVVLVQNGNLDLGNFTPIVKYVKYGSRVELPCTDSELSYLVWRKTTSSKQLDELVLYSVFLTKNFTRIVKEEHEMGNSGTLVIPEVKVYHEGLYRCISSNGIDDNVSAYEVHVYANPLPPHTVVEGCDKTQYCSFEVGYEGELKCTLNGIRPKVHLEFKTFSENDSSSIAFMNPQVFVNDNGETFDLILITEYHVRDKSSKRLAIRCQASGSNENMFNMTAVKVNLRFRQCIAAEAGVESSLKTLFILLICINITYLLILTCDFARKLLNRMPCRYGKYTPPIDNSQGTVASSPNGPVTSYL